MDQGQLTEAVLSGSMLASPVENAPAWFAARTRANMERSTKKRLVEQGIETLMPVVVQRQYSRRQSTRSISSLLVPSYLFLRVALTPPLWHLIHETKGVAGLVGRYVTRRVGGQREQFVVPLPLPSAEMGELLGQVNEAGEIERPATPMSDLTWKLMRVLAGPFTSFSGACEEFDAERGRVKVAVEIFGRAVPVEYDLADVELVRG
jgi:transcription antitermination factor NusG